MLAISYNSLMRAEQSYFNSHPLKVKKPSYETVLRKFYTDVNKKNIHSDSDNTEEDFNDEILKMDGVVMYGEPSAIELAVRWLADFPTVFSPRVIGNIWTTWFINKFPHRFSWVAEVLSVGAGLLGVVPKATLQDLASRTPYAILRSDLAFEGVEPLLRNNFTSLIVRHWIFMLYTYMFPKTRSYSLLSFFTGLDSLIVNVQFALFAFQEKCVTEIEVDLTSHFVILALSFLDLPDIFNREYFNYTLPTASRFVSYLYRETVRTISPLGSVDLQPLTAGIRRVTPELALVLSAPTGVGKSTRLVVQMHKEFSARTVVILPRRLLVLSITEFMRKSYPGLIFGAGTEGGFVPSDWDILYCTAQYAAVADLPTNALYVVDEAHVNEPFHLTISKHLIRNRRHVVFVTATPPPWLDTINAVRLTLPCTPRFTVERIHKPVNTYRDYLRSATEFVRDAYSGTKILVYVKYVQEAKDFRDSCGRPACIITSAHTDIDPRAEVFISTSVSDAGLTIPDVRFVLTSDQDFTLTSDVGSDDAGREIIRTKGLHYKLSKSTITQRCGRTGRTNDGIAIIFGILASAPNLFLTAQDYIISLGLLCKEFYDDLPIFVRTELPTLTYMHTKPTLWLPELAPNIEPDMQETATDSNDEVEEAIITAIRINAGDWEDYPWEYIFYSQAETEAILSDETVFPVILPAIGDGHPTVFIYDDTDKAASAWSERTGGDSIERYLQGWLNDSDLEYDEFALLLKRLSMHPISFASVAFSSRASGLIHNLPCYKDITSQMIAELHMTNQLKSVFSPNTLDPIYRDGMPIRSSVIHTVDANFHKKVRYLHSEGVTDEYIQKIASLINQTYVETVEFLCDDAENVELVMLSYNRPVSPAFVKELRRYYDMTVNPDDYNSDSDESEDGESVADSSVLASEDGLDSDQAPDPPVYMSDDEGSSGIHMEDNDHSDGVSDIVE
jgi:hypothetical protein